MLDSVKVALSDFEFDKISELSKEEFGELISAVLTNYTKSDEFSKLAIKTTIQAMTAKL